MAPLKTIRITPFGYYVRLMGFQLTQIWGFSDGKLSPSDNPR
jgi:hypothetical protein